MTIQTIIDNLPGNAKDLKTRCLISVCDERLLEHLDQGLRYARKLANDIEAIVEHLQKLKDRFSDEVGKQEGWRTVDQIRDT